MQAGLTLGEQLRRAVGPALDKAPEAKVLLLSCVDLRYPHRITDTMDAEGYRGRYYHLAMAGASHAAKHDATWAQAFADHLEFAVEHGRVTGVVVLDHLDCKAYQLYEGVRPGDIPGERAKHRDVAAQVIAGIVRMQPTLAGHVHALLLPVEPEPIRPEPLGDA